MKFLRMTVVMGLVALAFGCSGSGVDGISSSTPNRSCSTDADCSPGLECEIEVEHGVTTSFCKPHGGGKSGKH